MNQSDRKSAQIIGVAWYRPEQWKRLREISSDVDELEETYDEWLQAASMNFEEVEKLGVYLQKVDIDVNELLMWCGIRGLPVNGESRSRFVTEKLRTIKAKA